MREEEGDPIPFSHLEIAQFIHIRNIEKNKKDNRKDNE